MRSIVAVLALSSAVVASAQGQVRGLDSHDRE